MPAETYTKQPMDYAIFKTGGKQYRVQPGDIIDVRKVRDWERRLKASQLFEINPAMGKAPKVVVKPVEVLEGTIR